MDEEDIETPPGENTPETVNIDTTDTGAETQQKSDAEDISIEEKKQTPEERIAELEAQNAELNDKYLRKAADFENYRKRMVREKQEAIDFANTSLLLALVPVLDDFDRALAAAETSKKAETDFDAFIQGITMSEKRLRGDLEQKWGLKRFDSKDQPFDPQKHEALMSEQSAEVSEPTVAEEYLKGYTLKDRVVRFAKVKVLMPVGKE
jgi:molecular chaperone GrpE